MSLPKVIEEIVNPKPRPTRDLKLSAELLIELHHLPIGVALTLNVPGGDFVVLHESDLDMLMARAGMGLDAK